MPLFAYAGVEDQLAAMTEPQVRLPSGGEIVIHPTEALISIDVNSGRSTSERNVEETAIKTNMEAAQEVGRQLIAPARHLRGPDRDRFHRYGLRQGTANMSNAP